MSNSNTMMERDVRVLLHDIRSTHNVGAILRTSDAAGVARVYCSGYTPRPLDRFGRPVRAIVKTALGAEQNVPWEPIDDPFALIACLKQEGFTVVGIEQDPRAVNYDTFVASGKLLLIVGREVEGISPELRRVCDALIEIPMRGKLARERLPGDGGKESLNVSVAFGIALFHIMRRCLHEK